MILVVCPLNKLSVGTNCLLEQKPVDVDVTFSNGIYRMSVEFEVQT